MILANGCSFTYGDELDNPERDAWPAVLAAMANEPVMNLGQSGGSNDRILRTIVEVIEANSDNTKVVIAWTSPTRLEISNLDIHINLHRYHPDKSELIKMKDIIYRHWGEDWAWKKFHTQTHLLHGYLKSKNIPHLFLSTFDIAENFKRYRTQLPTDVWFAPTKNIICEWIDELGAAGYAPNRHPSVLGHRYIAEKIYEHTRNLGWFA